MENSEQCPVCASTERTVVATIGDLNKPLTNVICESCGLIFITPRKQIAEVEEFHVEDFLKNKGYEEADPFEHKLSASEIPTKKRIAEVIIPHMPGGGTVLDVGCGIGTLVSILLDRGYKAEGIELARIEIEAAKKFYDVDLYLGSLRKYATEHPEKKFDMIVLHHTLEHMTDPQGELHFMKSMLSENGKIYIGVPNVTNMKKRPEVYFESGHVVTYSPRSLAHALEAQGLYPSYFSTKAVYPGGMGVIAGTKPADNTALLQKEMKGMGHPKDVKYYIKKKGAQFATARVCRDIGLFFIPKKARVKIGRAISNWMKNR